MFDLFLLFIYSIVIEMVPHKWHGKHASCVLRLRHVCCTFSPFWSVFFLSFIRPFIRLRVRSIDRSIFFLPSFCSVAFYFLSSSPVSFCIVMCRKWFPGCKAIHVIRKKHRRYTFSSVEWSALAIFLLLVLVFRSGTTFINSFAECILMSRHY